MSTPRFAKRNPRQPTVCTLLAGIALLLPSAAAADQFPVTDTADSDEGSLRAAIEAANGHTGPDSIPIAATGAIDLLTPLPVLSDDVELAGPGQGALTVRRDSVADFRIFDVGNATVSISGMTVSGGHSSEGGGILSQGRLTLTEVTVSGNEAVASGEAETTALGGGVLAFGPLAMRQTTVSGNTASASEGGFQTTARGGGVAAFGGSSIDRSTVSGNSAVADGAAVSQVAVAEGAGLLLAGGKLNRLQRSTISGNSAGASGGKATSTAFGGAIGLGDKLTVTGSTVTGNSAAPVPPGGGANLDVGEETVVRDTIVSDPVGGGPNCGLGLISEGFNIDDGSSCGFAEPSDRSGVDPELEPNLAANGGPTPTYALLPGSPAIDTGSAFGAATDQRGLPRPSDFAAIAGPLGNDGSDIGAFELQALASPDTAAPDTTAPDTRIDREPPLRTRSGFARFRFSSTEPGSRFECALDDGPFRACAAPLARRVKRGARHVFRVRALDAAGNADQTPAVCAWRVRRPRPPAAHGR